jgi:hypothetical protein
LCLDGPRIERQGALIHADRLGVTIRVDDFARAARPRRIYSSAPAGKYSQAISAAADRVKVGHDRRIRTLRR